MKTQHSKEDLIHNLPDYISNRLSDNDLISEIETEIEINPEFKNESEEIRNTFDFLNTAELEAPHENYFNNLSVKINDRIGNEKISESFLEKFSYKWKVLIPALTVLIISTFLFINSGKDTAETGIADNVKPTGETVKSYEKEGISNIPDLQKRNEPISLPEKVIKKNSKQRNEALRNARVTRESIENNKTPDSKNGSNTDESETSGSLLAQYSNISENTVNDSEEDVLFMKDADEDNFEDELMELTPEDQKEIIENLSKSQI